MKNSVSNLFGVMWLRHRLTHSYIVRASVLGGLLLCQKETLSGQASELRDEEKMFYALGLSLARSTFNFDLTAGELEIVKKGLTDGVLKKQVQVKLVEYIPRLSTLAKERMAVARERQTALGLEFLARIASEPKSVQTKSGLVWTMIRDGTGPSVTTSDMVRAVVRQRLIDGTVVGDVELEDEPIVVSLSRALGCWKEGMLMMRVGGRSRLACPAALTYGDRDGPLGTKPGAVLVFDIEILEIIGRTGSVVPSNKP